MFDLAFGGFYALSFARCGDLLSYHPGLLFFRVVVFILIILLFVLFMLVLLLIRFLIIMTGDCLV